MQTFLHALLIVIKGNGKINPFLPMSKNYVGINDFEYLIVDDPLAAEAEQGLSLQQTHLRFETRKSGRTFAQEQLRVSGRGHA